MARPSSISSTSPLARSGPGRFRAWRRQVDSAVFGIAKPDPAIFGPALDALGTDPARTLYVGDTVHADVGGATAAGMAVVQLDPYDLHGDFDHAPAADVAALADLLLAVASPGQVNSSMSMPSA